MRVLLLGGTGEVGQEAARIFDPDPRVSGITVAARNQEAARKFAGTLSTPASAVAVNATDADSIAAAAAGHDLIVNAAGPDYQVMLPGLSAAIRSGTNYCDISADGPATEEALRMDAQARAAGVSALIGIGIAPGLTNLLGLHAARQMDAPELVEVAIAIPLSLFIPDPSRMLQSIRAGGRVNASLQTIVRWASSSVRTFDDGALTTVPGFTRSMDLPVLGGGNATAFEIGSAEPVTLPHAIAGVQAVRTYMAVLPDPLNAVLRELGARHIAEGLSTLDATIALLERMEAEPERLLAMPDGPPPIGVVGRASGVSGGHPAVVQCVPTSLWMTTHGALAVGALKLLSGELSTPGVLSPESCLDPEGFFAEVAAFGPVPPGDGGLIRVEELPTAR